MRTPLITLCAIFLAGAAPATKRPQAVSTASAGWPVSGTIQLLQGKSRTPAKDASSTVVWLEPVEGLETVALGPGRKTYRMTQQNKQFHPHLLVVPLGSVVLFPNLDPWFHNVFSLYRGKRFDLGLYEAGSQKEVRFDRPGASYIFCNIHPEMMAVVLTVDTPYYTVSGKSGNWAILAVPPGRYRLHVWYENATPETLQALTHMVQVGDGGAALATMSIPITPRDWMNHTNLYGRKYDPKSLKPVY